MPELIDDQQSKSTEDHLATNVGIERFAKMNRHAYPPIACNILPPPVLDPNRSRMRKFTDSVCHFFGIYHRKGDPFSYKQWD